MNVSRAREMVTNAIKFWEPLRLIYNGALAIIVMVSFFSDYPHSRSQLTVDLLLILFLFAVMANVAYCAAYIVDLFVQASAFHAEWLRFRWILFLIGLAFAGILSFFISGGIFGHPA